MNIALPNSLDDAPWEDHDSFLTVILNTATIHAKSQPQKSNSIIPVLDLVLLPEIHCSQRFKGVGIHRDKEEKIFRFIKAPRSKLRGIFDCKEVIFIGFGSLCPSGY